MIYVFGAFLVFTGVKMALQRDDQDRPRARTRCCGLRRVVPLTPDYHGPASSRARGRPALATPLLAVLVVVETTDVVFAVDSIPAIFAVTDDPFIVFTSNVFAILGLRALYFLLAGMIDRFPT